jgi:MATE family multidrug resistance protein
MRELLRLALPVVSGHLGIMFMSVVDIWVVGRVSAVALGAVGIGTSVFSWFFLFAIGLLSSLEFLISHALGEDRPERAQKYLTQGLLLSLFLGFLLNGLLLFASNHLEVFGLTPEVIEPSQRYLRILSYSLVPGLLFTTCRAHLQSKQITRPAVLNVILGNGVNLVLNLILVFGLLGAPRMEAEGSAWATLVARWVMASGMVYAVAREERGLSLRYDAKEMKQIWRLGLPSALQMTFEVGVFAYSTTLAGRLSAELLAAHQVVLNIASVSFMVPYGIGSATAVLVGRAMGQKNSALAVHVGRLGIGLGVGFMATSALVFFLLPRPILALYTDQPEVISAALSILWIAALFQLSDGAQAVATGALRGVSDTRSSALANFIGHWGIGLPLGYTLCFYAQYSLMGLWAGLAIGLTAVAVFLLFAWRRNERRLLTPLE